MKAPLSLCALCGGAIPEEDVVIDPILDHEGDIVSLLAYHPECIDLVDYDPLSEPSE